MLHPKSALLHSGFCLQPTMHWDVALHFGSVPLHTPMDCDFCSASCWPSAMQWIVAMWCRTSEELMLYLGCKLGYWRGDIKGLVDDIGIHHCTLQYSNFSLWWLLLCPTSCPYIELSWLRITIAVKMQCLVPSLYVLTSRLSSQRLSLYREVTVQTDPCLQEANGSSLLLKKHDRRLTATSIISFPSLTVNMSFTTPSCHNGSMPYLGLWACPCPNTSAESLQCHLLL